MAQQIRTAKDPPPPPTAGACLGLTQPPPSMAAWRMRLFITLARNSGSAARYFRIPATRVVELGTQVII